MSAAPAQGRGETPLDSVDGYGGFTLGDMQLALPMSALREVVPLHGLLTLPCPAPCVVGGIDLRGVVVPVVDLHIVLGRPRRVVDQPCVIIVVHGGRLLGLLADGVTGVFSPQPGQQRQPLDVLAGGAIFAGSLRRADTQAMVSLLSPDALARLPQVPMTDDPEPERELKATERRHDGPLDRTVPVMLMRCGGVALAIDALSVHATLSDPVLRPSAVAMGHCRGVMDYDGRRVPAVDLMALCGLGEQRQGVPLQAFVMRFPQGLVGLLVEEVMDVVNIDSHDVVPVPAFALPEPALFAGALPATVLAAQTHARRGLTVPQFLLLSGPALLACEALTALSAVNVADAGSAGACGPSERRGMLRLPAGGAAAAAGPQPREMITYELFGEEATPIEQLAEILRYDEQMAAFEPRGPLVGLVVHRGRSIPVMCLRRMAGLESLPRSDSTSVLVIKSDDDWVGFAVPRLRAIESVRWSPSLPDGGMGPGDALAHTLQSRELALVDAGGSERMLRVLDLAGIARALRGRPRAEPAEALAETA